MIGSADLAGLATRAWIGDGFAGALVGADGTLEWYSGGGNGAPADFFSLLDPAGGALRIGPAGARQPRRAAAAAAAVPAPPGTGGSSSAAGAGPRYRGATMVAETELAGPAGVVRITDFLPWPGPNERPPGRLVRLVTALAGPLDVEVEVRPGWAWRTPGRVSGFGEGVAWEGLVVRTGFPLLATAPGAAGTPGGPTTWRGARRLEPGESFVVTVEAAAGDRQAPLSPDAARSLLESTAAAWRSWVFPLRATGPYRDAAERSALLVRSLSGAGAPLAAGTSSLPRRPGSERSEDERIVRWRDAAAAARVLSLAGFAEDAEAAEAWLRAAVTATDLPWPAALAADGAPTPEEDEELPLAGWRHGQPVLAGGSVGRRRDLDVYGDVAEAVSASTLGEDPAAAWSDPAGDGWRSRPHAPGPLAGAPGALAAAADWVGDHWREPDAGVWSLAGPPRRLVASRLAAWYALERTARLARAANPLDLAAAGWSQAARDVLAWIERDGIAPDGGLKLDGQPGDHADAALLRVAWRGPWPAEHPVVTATIDRTLERLGHGPLVYRHSPEIDDGHAGADNPDLLASLWAVRALAAAGRWDEAHERMERICALPGPAGIFSTAADPVSGELFGNLPATGVHLALIDAALALERGPR